MQATLTFGGDLMLGRSFDSDPVYPWSPGVLALIQDTLFCANLETAVTTHTDPWPNKMFNYKVAPTTFARLLPPSPMMLNLANNHILDFKTPGLIETATTLTKLGIPYAGLSIEPTLVTYQGLTFGLLGFTDHPDEWRGYGVNYFDSSFSTPRSRARIDGSQPVDPDVHLAAVRQAAAKVHVLVVYLHFGPNWVDIYADAQRWAQALINAGARVVVNTSPHHILPIERYQQGLILNSPGAVVDDYAINAKFRNDLGVLVQVSFDLTGAIIGGASYPIKIESMRVRRIDTDEPDYTWVVQHLMGTVP